MNLQTRLIDWGFQSYNDIWGFNAQEHICKAREIKRLQKKKYRQTHLWK